MDASMVQLGSRVCIRDADGEAEFSIVPSEDADVAEGRVSAENTDYGPRFSLYLPLRANRRAAAVN